MEKRIIGVVGCGIVGGNTARLFEEKASETVTVLKYDKYKTGEWVTMAELVDRSEIIFVCLPTPMKDNGSIDLEYVHGTLSEIDHYIGRKEKPDRIIVIRSTIIPGSTKMLRQMFPQLDIAVVPEFLTESNPWKDTLNATRIVIGTPDYFSYLKVESLFRLAYGSSVDYIAMSATEAEMYKYACNYFLAMSVLAANELYNICQAFDIDYESIQQYLKYDRRIGSFTQVPGPDGDWGIGGKCVKGDVKVIAEDNRAISMKSMYHRYIRHHKLPRILSCDASLSHSDYKDVVSVKRRYVLAEDMVSFNTENGAFVCTADHLLPVLRDKNKMIVAARDVLITDELIFWDGDIKCAYCGSKASHIADNGKFCCSDYHSKCPALRRANKIGLRKAWKSEELRNRHRESVRKANTSLQYRENMRRIVRKRYAEDATFKDKCIAGLKKRYSTDPTLSERKRISMLGKNKGESNGAKKMEVRKLASDRQKRRFEDKSERLRLSQTIADKWRKGCYKEAPVGKCKWYSYKSSSGDEYKVQGTWELAFIKWLDDSGLTFKCHRGRIKYCQGGVSRSYYPDFWVNEWRCFVDVKCEHFYDREKMDLIKLQNQHLDIRVLLQDDLKGLGVIL